jgi:prophage antirepressor-like protein
MQIYKEHYFSYLNYPLRVVYIDEKPWFLAKDLAEILDYIDIIYIENIMEDDEIKEVFVSENYSQVIVNTQGVYRLLFEDYDESPEFRHWFNDNLPSICFHGIVNKPEKDIFKAKHIEEKRLDLLDARVNSIYNKLLPALKEIDQMKIEIAQSLTKMEKSLGLQKSY